MRKLILRVSISVDGILESSEENIDFAKSRGPEGAAWIAEKIAQAGAHLMGRNAFCQMASFWPTAAGPLAQSMNEIPKIVFSKKGFDPSRAATQAKGQAMGQGTGQILGAKSWAEAKVMTGDLAEAIAGLKQEAGKDLLAHGGLEFAQNLVERNLVDEFWLITHPVVAAKGIKLFEKLSKPLYLNLVESKVFSSGTMANIYRPE